MCVCVQTQINKQPLILTLCNIIFIAPSSQIKEEVELGLGDAIWDN